jgi:hypothetical protein
MVRKVIFSSFGGQISKNFHRGARGDHREIDRTENNKNIFTTEHAETAEK